MILVSDLTFSYPGTEKTILKNLSFTACPSEILTVLGANGTGKSTLFKCILGFLTHYAGKIELTDRSGKLTDLTSLSISGRAKSIAYVPQNHSSPFEYQVLEMVAMGSYASRSVWTGPAKLQKENAAAILEDLGLGHLIYRNFARLSGGEKQLVLIARALHQNTRTLILDEPCANLDYGNQIRVLEKIRQLSDKGYTVLLSSHNPNQTFLFSHKVLALSKGEKIAFGKPDDVITEDTIRTLYGITGRITQVPGFNSRICIPEI